MGIYVVFLHSLLGGKNCNEYTTVKEQCTALRLVRVLGGQNFLHGLLVGKRTLLYFGGIWSLRLFISLGGRNI